MRRALRYHETSKHTYESVRPSPALVSLGPPRRLDWSNQPSPFRHFEGAPERPLTTPPLEGRVEDVLGREPPARSPAIDHTFLGALLHHSLAISAWKESHGERWSLRCNPSSGNLHPTEAYVATKDALYHYRVDHHALETRREGDVRAELHEEGEAVLVLASIFWREAWKYRERAYRYCALDAGHAAHAVLLAARALGAATRIVARFDEERVREALALTDEVPFLILPIGKRAAKGGEPGPPLGAPSRLSPRSERYAAIDEVAAASRELVPLGRPISADTERLPIALPAPTLLGAPFALTARRRRSALDFDPRRSTLSLADLAALLRAARAPLPSDTFTPDGLTLYMWAHAVAGLEPALYRVGQDSLERVAPSSRDEAAYVSLEQEIARDGALAFSIVADLDAHLAFQGDRGYRDALIAAGAVGHALYIGAEALNLAGTGIGAFYDDDTSRVLHLLRGAPIYHFAIGAPVFDPRLR